MKRQMHHRLQILFCGLLLLGLAVPASPSGGPTPRSSLKTVVGEVLEIRRIAGEGGIEVIQVSLAPEGDREHPLQILLAPAEAMESIGFTVEPGDRLKVKYFVGGEGTPKAHKVLNASRGLMVRMRTLQQIPMWDNQGCWQGCQDRMHHIPGGGRGGTH